MIFRYRASSFSFFLNLRSNYLKSRIAVTFKVAVIEKRHKWGFEHASTVLFSDYGGVSIKIIC